MTEKIMNEEELGASEALYRTLVNTSPLGMHVCDLTGQIRYSNPACHRIMEAEEGALDGKYIWDLLSTESDKEQLKSYFKILTEEQPEPEPVYSLNRSLKGNLIDVKVNWNYIRDSKGKLVGFCSVVDDITEKRRIEKALLESESKLRAIISHSPVGIATCDSSGRCTSVNAALADIIGASEAQVLKQNYHDLASWKEAGLYEMALKAVHDNSIEQMDTRVNTSFGKTFHLHSYFVPLDSGELLVLMQDISDLKRAECSLTRALEEKTTLIKEIHHRIKNNLALIQSLLRLQSFQSGDESARSALDESQSRVQAMSMIHERLYRSSDLSNIEFSDYISSLSNQIHENYCRYRHDIKMRIDIPRVTLDLDAIIPCGLIVNELLTNAFKYSFPEGRTGEVFVGTEYDEGGQLLLIVRDNGVGLPEDFEILKSDSLGMSIVDGLAKQIGKGVQVSTSDEGTEFIVPISIDWDQ